MSFKTPILCDRRVYAFKGKWKNPNNDIADNIYYFIKENLTLVPSYVNGREEYVETITIVVLVQNHLQKKIPLLYTMAHHTRFKTLHLFI